jgi:hypothetical protein
MICTCTVPPRQGANAAAICNRFAAQANPLDCVEISLTEILVIVDVVAVEFSGGAQRCRVTVPFPDLLRFERFQEKAFDQLQVLVRHESEREQTRSARRAARADAMSRACSTTVPVAT